MDDKSPYMELYDGVKKLEAQLAECQRQRDAAVDALEEIKRLGWSAKQKTIRRMSDIAHLALALCDERSE